MRFGILAGVSAIGCLAFVVGCGDDEDGTGGAGGSGTTTVAATTTAMSSSSTGMMLAPLGAPCGTGDTCDGGVCLDQDTIGWAGGYCTTTCDPTFAPCEEGECVGLNSGGAVCLKSCDVASMNCGVASQTCLDLNDDGTIVVCVGGCKTAADCGAGFKCDTMSVDSGACVPNEVCTGGMDEDGDGLADCEDPECGTDAGCMTAISGACSATTPLMLGTATMGTTSGMTSNFVSNCGGGGAPEKLYSVAITGDGFLVVSLDSAADMGVSLRTTCADGTSEKICADIALGGETEHLTTQVKNGDMLTLIVDGYEGGRDGDFTVNANLVPQQNETEMNGSVLTANNVTLANGIGIVGASINPTADEDWFTFTIPAAADVDISTNDFGMGVCGVDIDTLIELTDVTGLTIIDSNDDKNPLFGDFCSAISHPMLAAGTYHVHVVKSDLAMPATLTFEYALQISAQ